MSANMESRSRTLAHYRSILSPQQAAALVSTSILLYLVAVVIYRIFFHPLSKYPGPFLGKITEWNTIIPALRGNPTATRHNWTRRYGAVVRVGPNEPLYDDLSTIKEIYGQNSAPCIKDAGFYAAVTATGATNVFNVCDRYEHARIRRLLSHAFSQRELASSEDQMHKVIRNFLDRVEQSAQPVEFYHLVSYLYLDNVSYFAFGRSFGCLNGENVEAADAIEKFQLSVIVKGMFPLIDYVPLKAVQESVGARKHLIRFAQTAITGFRAELAAGRATENSFLGKLIAAKEAESGESFSQEELIENAIIFMLAGTETTMTTTLHLYHELAKQPEKQKKLVEEIRTAFPDKTIMPTFDKLNTLPYLSMVWDETLRLRGPLPVHLPRISPGKIIGGDYIPQGVRVGSLAYSSHMNHEIFPEPEAFIPERWANPTTDMKLAFRPFSIGPRNCIGMHLARMVGLLTVGALYQRYDITLDHNMTPDLMIPEDYGTMVPSGKKVLLRVANA